MKPWVKLSVPTLATALLLIPTGLASASAATPTSPAPPTAAASPTPPTPEQVAFARTVAQFASTHTPPVVNSTDPATYAQQNVAAYEYLKVLPVQALYGQYGCAVSFSAASMQVGGDGVNRATADRVVSCPAGVDTSLISPNVLPRADAHVAAPSQSTMAVITPQNWVNTCSNTLSSGVHCIGQETTTSEHDFKYTWYGSGTITGHVRAGTAGIGQPCANGTFLGNSADHTIGYGSSIIQVVWPNYSSTFSNSFYPPSPGALRTRWCASM
jgi:hypothetical protein